jgi:hypothetical protein
VKGFVSFTTYGENAVHWRILLESGEIQQGKAASVAQAQEDAERRWPTLLNEGELSQDDLPTYEAALAAWALRRSA